MSFKIRVVLENIEYKSDKTMSIGHYRPPPVLEGSSLKKFLSKVEGKCGQDRLNLLSSSFLNIEKKSFFCYCYKNKKEVIACVLVRAVNLHLVIFYRDWSSYC